MQKQFVVLFLVIFLLQLSPDNNLFAQTWETHTCKDNVTGIYCAGDYCWVATTGGVVKVNINDFSFEEFDQDDGVAKYNYSSQISTIYYNNETWIGSNISDGISIYDGSNWMIYDNSGYNFKDSFITCFYKDRQNHLWIGTTKGIIEFDGQTWENYNYHNSTLLFNNISSIDVDHDNNILVGTSQGYSIFDGEKWSNVKSSDTEDGEIYSGKLVIDHQNNKWTTMGGYYNNARQEWIKFKDSTNIIDPYINVIFVDSKNVKWFGTTLGRVYTFNDTTWSVFNSSNSLLPVDPDKIDYLKTHYFINAINEDQNGHIWIGTEIGLFFYDGKDWKKVQISGELPYRWVTSIAVDTKNNIWYGTQSGVAVDRNGIWQIYNTSNSSLKESCINEILTTSSGNIFIAPRSQGLIKVDKDTLRYLDESDGFLSSFFVWSMTEDKNGTLWCGSWGGRGILEYNGTEYKVHNDPENLIEKTAISEIAIDSYNNKWLSTSDINYFIGGKCYGIIQLNDTNWSFYDKNNCGIINNNVNAMAIDKNDNIWAGTYAGVSYFNGVEWITFNISNCELASNYIESILIDSKGRKWFGTFDKGVSMYDGEKWTTFNTENSKLNDVSVYSLAEDNDGNIIIGTSFGVYIYKENGISETKKLTNTKTPEHLILHQNYPNPFNAGTKIKYSIISGGQVKLNVYNLQGQLVQTLFSGYTQPGEYSAHWNGLDAAGNPAASGVYFYRLIVNDQTIETKRLVLLK